MGRNLRSLWGSLRCAARGFGYCVRGERNIRIHITAALLVLWLSGYYEFSTGKYAALIFAIGSVITTEMLNTAVEVLVDLHTSSYHALARVAKDVAAGAVLVAAVASGCVGVVLFWDTQVISAIFADLVTYPVRAVPPVTIVVAGAIFIFGLPRSRAGRHND